MFDIVLRDTFPLKLVRIPIFTLRMELLRGRRLLRACLTNAGQSARKLGTGPNVGAGSKLAEKLDFTDAKAVYAKKSVPEMVRALVVLRLCGVQSLVGHASQLLSLGEKLLGRGFVKWVLKQTFFGHFCAGEDQDSIRPRVQALDRAGVGSILDYAAEVSATKSPYQFTFRLFSTPSSCSLLRFALFAQHQRVCSLSERARLP